MMSRNIERKLLRIGAIWNIFTAIITMFGYSSWFKHTGIKELKNTAVDTQVVGMQLMDDINKVILTFSLLILVGGSINFILSKKLRDNDIQNKIVLWIAIWGIFQLLVMDVIGFIIFLITFTIYLSKNKAIKLSRTSNLNSYS